MTTPSLFISCFVSVSTLASTGPLAPTALFLFLFSFFLFLYASCLTEHGFSILFGLFFSHWFGGLGLNALARIGAYIIDLSLPK